MPGALRLTTEILISVDGDCFPGGQENMSFSILILCKRVRERQKAKFYFFCSLDSFNCR